MNDGKERNVHTHKTLPWEGADEPYAGTLSSLSHSSKTARETRGKSKCNKRDPRGMTGHRYPRTSARKLRTPEAVIQVRQPEVVRYNVGTHILTDD